MRLIGLSITIQFVGQLLHAVVQRIDSSGKIVWLSRLANLFQLLATLNQFRGLNEPATSFDAMCQRSQARLVILYKQLDQGTEVLAITDGQFREQLVNHPIITLAQLFKISQINLPISHIGIIV